LVRLGETCGAAYRAAIAQMNSPHARVDEIVRM
jgi:hypothetical protein